MSFSVTSLVEQLSKKERFITVDAMFLGFDKLFANAMQIEPRLIAFVDSYTGTSQQTGLRRTFLVEVTYLDTAPAKIEDVIFDNVKFDLEKALAERNDLPVSLSVLTHNTTQLMNRCSASFDTIVNRYPQLLDLEYSYQTEGAYQLVVIHCVTGIPGEQMTRMREPARNKAKTYAQGMFGGRGTPLMVKIFLAFSYLQQHCSFDKDTDDLLGQDKIDNIPQPASLSAFGPLVEGRGTSLGIALAMKLLMDECGVVASVIQGFAGEGQTHRHWWNQLRLGDQAYHIDASWGYNVEGVHIGKFMKTDGEMQETHAWNRNLVPSADGRQYNFDRIEAYINENARDLLDDGVNERLLFPDIIE